MDAAYLEREELTLTVLLALGEEDSSYRSLQDLADGIDRLLLDVLWAIRLLDRLGYVETRTFSPMQVRLTRPLDSILVDSLFRDIRRGTKQEAV